MSREVETVADGISWNYAILVYPFFHRLATPRAARLQGAERRWQHWMLRLNDEELMDALDDTYFFLPHVREILFPETCFLDNAMSGREQAARFRDVLNAPLSELADDERSHRRRDRKEGATLPSDRGGYFERGMLRTTLKKAELSRYRSLLMQKAGTPRGEPAIPLQIDWVDVALFPHDIGLLMLKVQVPLENFQDIVRALDYARHVFEPQAAFQPVQLTSVNEADWTGNWRTLVEELLTEFIEPDAAERTHRRQDPSDNGVRVPYTLSNAAEGYGETFRQLIAVARPPSPEFRGRTTDAGAFANSAERSLHDLVIGHDSLERDWTPSEERVDAFRARSILSYWQEWCAASDWGNLAFVLESCEFVDRVVRYNIEYDYLPLFVLSVFQQIRLQTLGGEIISRGREPRENAVLATSLWADLITFRNRYWFQEVTTKPVGAALYRLLRESLNLERIHQTLASELDALRVHLQDRVDENQRLTQWRLNVGIAVVTFLIPLQFMLLLFPQRAVPWSFLPTPNVEVARWAYAGIALGWIVVVGLLFVWPFGSRRRR